MKSAPLKILLLGPVEIKFDDELLIINRRMERAILYVLALEEKPVSRTRLIDLLWPDADQSDPRRALRTALSRLRNELPDPDFLQTELDQVWLDYDRCYIDLQAFEDQYQNLLHLLTAYQSNQTLPTSVVDRIQKALGLWRGNKIIAGDNLSKYPAIDIWRQSINNKLNHRRKYLMQRLAEHYQISGQLEKALTTFMSLSRIDSSDVSSQCAALDILISMGRHQDAMNYCDTLENIYEHEFDSPLPDDILSRCQHSKYRISHKQSEEQYQWPIPLTMNLPLVDQQTELYQLHRAFTKGGWVSIQGALGIGKTRLVKELFDTLTPKPILILAYCREMEKSLPFSPIINCLRTSVPEEIWQEIDPAWVNQLSLLLPELRDYIDESEQLPLSKLPAGKLHLFDALLNLCYFITKKYGKILFFLDNAHWADGQTLQVISYFLSQGFFESHGLLIIASRPEERNPELDNLINQSFRSKPVQIIELTGLDFVDLKNLVMQVLDKPPSEDFLMKLMRETNGNPFLALEIIRNILETADAPDKLGDQSSLPLPMSIHVILRKRLSSLGEESRSLLLSAAALGDNLSIDTLETVTDQNPSEISTAIEPLLKSGFLQSASNTASNDNHLHFSNEIIREVVLKEASNVHLQILHRQIAQRLASDTQYNEKAAAIANHYLLGGDAKEGFHWLLKAAEYAWRLGSQKDAQEAYEKAEKISRNGSESEFTISELLKLYHQWSEFAYESHQVDLVEQLGAKLQYLGGRENHPLLLGTAQVIFSNACFLRLDFNTGLDLIQEGITNLEIAGEKESLIKAIKRKGVISWWTMDYDQVEISANRVLELCQQSTLNENFKSSMEFNARHLINMLYYARGQAQLSLQTALTLHKTYFHKLEPFDRLRSLYLIGYSSLIAAEYDQCEAFTQRALEIARPLGNGLLEEVLLIILSKAEFIQGKFEQSYQHATQALKSAESANRKQNIISANCILGDIFRVLGSNTTALQHFRIAQIREGFSSISFFGIENNIHLSNYLFTVDQIEEAKKILQQYLPIAKKYNLGALYIQGLLSLGTLNISKGNLAGAEKSFSAAMQLAEENGLRHELMVAKTEYARLLMIRDQSNEAKVYLDEVIKVSRDKNMILTHLSALALSAKRLKENNELVEVLKRKLAFNSIVEKLQEKIKSEPLKNLFSQTSDNWKKNFPNL